MPTTKWESAKEMCGRPCSGLDMVTSSTIWWLSIQRMHQQVSKDISKRTLLRSLTLLSLYIWMISWSRLMVTEMDTSQPYGGFWNNSGNSCCMPIWRKIDVIRKMFSSSAMWCLWKVSAWRRKESRQSNSSLNPNQYEISKCSSDLWSFIIDSSRDSAR